MEKQNILIVDDEPAITQSLKRSLRDEYEVFTANSAAEALEVMRVNEIAVIITDQRMPDMQGVDFLVAARAIQPNSLSVLLSGYSDVQALIGALNIKTVRGFIPKPWDNQALLEKISDAAKEYRVVFKNPKLLQTYTQAIDDLQRQVNEFKKLVETISVELNQGTSPSEWLEQQTREASSVIHLYEGGESSVSARMVGLLPLREANPEKFESFKTEYMACLEQSFEQRTYNVSYPISKALKKISNDLGALRAGPRDVIEIHYSALMAIFEKYHLPRRQVYISEGRLLVLELMGNLVQFYRSNSIWPQVNHEPTT